MGDFPEGLPIHQKNLFQYAIDFIYHSFILRYRSQEGSFNLEERRQHNRLAVRKKVRLKLPDIEDKPCGKSFCYSLCEDISQGGIKIPSEYFLPVKQAINMEIFLEDSFGIVSTRGEVRWITSTNADFKYEVGIEFVDISTESKNCLNKFCQLQN